jgi:glycosyltransferase involved in cell wall biosynthesis
MLAEFCREVQPDVLHGHGAKGGAYARLVAAYPGSDLKAVYTPHGGSLHYGATSPAGLMYLGLERLLKQKTHGLIFESQYSADTYEKKLGSISCDYKIIHNGLREEEFQNWSDKNVEYDFVFVGELRMLKGIDVLLQAVEKVKESRPVKVLIVGAGPDEEFFKNKVLKPELKDAIRISSPIYPARDAFKLGRCVVMPSLAESFPYIVLEALAAGSPLITTNVGGIPEIFGPYKDDLIPAGDVSALVDALVIAMENPEQLVSRSTEIQGYVKSRFSLQKMLDEVKMFYYQILELDQ